MLKRLKKGKQKQKSSDLGESLKAKKPATYSPIHKQIIIEAVKDLTIMKIDVRKSMGAIMFLVTLGKC